MTPRAIVIGLLCAAAVCAFCFFNDFVIKQTFLVGNYMPISVYGGLLVFLLVVNPILLALSKRLALTGRELAVIVALTLAACYVPGRGLMHYFFTFQAMPHHYKRTQAGWKKMGVVDLAPRQMLVSIPPEYSLADIRAGSPAEVARRIMADDPLAKAIRNRLDDRSRELLSRLAHGMKPADLRSLRDVLNSLLEQADLARELPTDQLALPAEAKRLAARPQAELDTDDRRRLNRYVLDAVLGPTVRSLAEKEDVAIGGFVQGLSKGGQHIRLSEVPWYAWGRSLRFWLPLLLSISIALIGLAVVVHRQWSDHEQLAYPIVSFANTLLPTEGQARGSVFHQRAFWIGLGLVLVIHLNNYACEWWPRYLVRVPVYFDFRSLSPLIPALQRGGDWGLMNPTVYFTPIGFAFFLSTDVSFSLGIAPYLYAIAVGILAGYGVSVRGGGFIALNIEKFLFGGAYFGMFLVMLYTGRHYYASVFRRSVFIPTTEDVERQAVWGARVFLVFAGLFAVQLAMVGLPLYLAVAYTIGATIIFTVISRLVSETGVFFIHAYHFPCVMLWGFLGARVLGPRSMLIMFMVSALLLIDPREAVMPFFSQALKLVDLNKEKVGRVAKAGVVALLLGFAVAIPVTLYLHYDLGVGKVTDGWTRGVPRMPFDATVAAMERLENQGLLDQAGKYSGLEWFRNITPNRTCVLAFFIAMGLVLLFAAARLRFPRWPFHPVMFIVLGTFQSRTLAFSFLIGCLIKVLVTKYGGAAGYRRVKPFMIGVIAGDMLGGLIPMIVGAIYYFSVGEVPKRFLVLPL